MKINLDIPKNKFPTLYDINQSFDYIKFGNQNGIKGEYKTRMAVFTNFVLGRQCMVLKGSRSSGKTCILEVTSYYAKNPVTLDKSSEKVYLRNNSLNEASHFIIPEINKIHDNTLEMLKDFGEGKPSFYTFLNEYRIAERVKIEPKPFITSIADENKTTLGEELLSRLTVVNVDSSVEQNILVVEDKLERAANPFKKSGMSQSKIKEYRQYVHNLPSVDELEFVYLPGKTMRKVIPTLFTDSRRDISKYLNNTYGIATFHYYDRIVIEKNKKKYLLITPADVWYNHIIFNDIVLESALKCNPIERAIIDILKEYRTKSANVKNEFGLGDTGLTAKAIRAELVKRRFTPTLQTVKKYCSNLFTIGYIVANEERKIPTYEISDILSNEYINTINWTEIIEACKKTVKELFPTVADEYIQRFCEGDGLKVINPFTGEETRLDSKIQENKQKKKTIRQIVNEALVESNLFEDVVKFTIDNSNYSQEEIIQTLNKMEEEMEIIIKNGKILFL